MKRGAKNINFIIRTAGSRSGFTLLELLIATAIFLIIISSAMGLYITHQKHAYVQEEVTDLQQSLRLGTESILQDLRMAGMAVPSSSNPIALADNNTGLNGSDIIRLNSVSSDRSLALINIEPNTYVNFIAGTPVTFIVRSASEAASFDPASIGYTGDIVRILNPTDKSQPAKTYFTVTGVDTAAPSLTLIPSANSDKSIFIPNGTVIAETGKTVPDTFPNEVEYCIGPVVGGCGEAITSCPASDCLIRMVNGEATEVDIAATNISGLQIAYLTDGNAVEVDTLGALQNVRAVRVTLTGVNTETKDFMPGQKTRELTTIVKMRNR